MNTKLPSKSVLTVNFKAFNHDRAAGIPWKKEPDDVNLSFTANYLSTACKVGGKLVRGNTRPGGDWICLPEEYRLGFFVWPKHTVYIESAFYLLSPWHLIPLPFSVHSFVPADSADDVSSGASSVAVEIKIRPIARRGERSHFSQMKQFSDVVVLRRLSHSHDRCPSNFVVFVQILATL